MATNRQLAVRAESLRRVWIGYITEAPLRQCGWHRVATTPMPASDLANSAPLHGRLQTGERPVRFGRKVGNWLETKEIY